MKWIPQLAACFVMMFVALACARGADDGFRASKPEVRKAVVTIVEGQLAAFRTGDLKQAYGYASSALRAQKPLRVFTTIVQENYPEIWANTRAECGLVHDDGEHATLVVHVFTKANDAAYDYTLTKESAGWRIAAVLRHATKTNDTL